MSELGLLFPPSSSYTAVERRIGALLGRCDESSKRRDKNPATLALSDACLRPERAAASREAVASRCTLAERIAHAMRGHFGVSPGDRVGIMLSPEFAEVFLAIGSSGAIAVPLNVKPNHDEYASATACLGAKLVFATPYLVEPAARLANVLPELEIVLVAPSADYDRLVASEVGPIEPVWRAPDDLAWIFRSTRAICGAKVAILPHRNSSVMIYSHLCDVRIL
jgi:long-chain acyl-CoA synthetase